MKKANFNTLKNLPVPESWIENALAIPTEQEKKPAALPFWKKPRFIAMAASLVLVSALSLALFLTMGSKPPVTVKPSSTEIVWSTDEHGATVATEIVVVPAQEEHQSGTEPTEQKSGVIQFFERILGIEDNTSPTTKPSPTEGGRIVPTTKQEPTESKKPVIKPTESGKPAELPTEAPTEDNGEVIINGPGGWVYEKPTEEPPEDATTEPTEGENVPPTSTPWVSPSEPSWEDPPSPTVPKPTQSRYKASVSLSVSVYTVSMINKEGGVVYCRIYDSSGNSYGDSDRYSDQHLAALTLTYDSRTLSYTPRDYGILPEDGYYSYEFYTRSGKSLITGNAYLSAS